MCPKNRGNSHLVTLPSLISTILLVINRYYVDVSMSVISSFFFFFSFRCSSLATVSLSLILYFQVSFFLSFLMFLTVSRCVQISIISSSTRFFPLLFFSALFLLSSSPKGLYYHVFVSRSPSFSLLQLCFFLNAVDTQVLSFLFHRVS